jgi:hypothetical protein
VETARFFFEKAEYMAEELSGSVSPSLLKALTKTRLMQSRLLQTEGKYRESLVLLWKNVNTLAVECSVRMNFKLDPKQKKRYKLKIENKKLTKWAKYFILNLHQMIAAFIMLEEMEASLESTKLMEWLTESFFDSKSVIAVTLVNYINSLTSGLNFELGLKNDIMSKLKKAIKDNFQFERYKEFVEEKEHEKTALGFIPSLPSELEELEQEEQPKKAKKKSKKKRARRRAMTFRRQTTNHTKESSVRHTEVRDIHSPPRQSSARFAPNHKKNLSLSTNFTSMIQPSIYSKNNSKAMDVYFQEKTSTITRNKSDMTSLKSPEGSKIMSTLSKRSANRKQTKRKTYRLKRSLSSRTRNTKGRDSASKKQVPKFSLKCAVDKLKTDEECKGNFVKNFFFRFEKREAEDYEEKEEGIV